jgi:hypothetical protein
MDCWRNRQLCAGGNGRGFNQFNNPQGFFDAAGNIFVDYRIRIQKWSPDATEGITVAGGNGQEVQAIKQH